MSEIDSQIESGMRRQLHAFHQALDSGMPRLGWKIGINDPAAQQRLGLPSPIVGWLDGRRLIPDGDPYVAPEGAKPRIEAETAILLHTDVPANATLDAAREAIASVAPAIEFVNGAKPLSPVEELLAHDILHDAVMIGPGQPLQAASGLVAAGFPAVSLDGQPHRVGLAGRYPDDLAEIVVLVANTLARYGESLNAGDWIIAGSYIDPFDIAPGSSVSADFGPLGGIEFSVAP
jgi:2-oxo-hept-3-ene-1,7-dioate hydratase